MEVGDKKHFHAAPGIMPKTTAARRYFNRRGLFPVCSFALRKECDDLILSARAKGSSFVSSRGTCLTSFARDTFTFNYPSPPATLADEFRKYYGPTMNAFEAAEKNGRAADLQKELEELFNRQNQSPRKDATSIPATFLRVTVAL